MKKRVNTGVCFTVLIFALLFGFTVNAANLKYEVYNNGEPAGITSVILNDDGKEYIKIEEIYKLNLLVEDIDNGIRISNGLKYIDVLFDAEYAYFEDTKIKDPVFEVGNKDYRICLDVIGKCFSDGYGGSLSNDESTWRIYLRVGKTEPESMSGLVTLKQAVFNFSQSVCSLQLENESYYSFKNVKLAIAAYDGDGRLTDIKINKKYDVEPKEKLTAVIPIGNAFDGAGAVKLMAWSDNKPLIDALVPKACHELSYKPPKELFSDVDVNSRYYDAVYYMRYNFSEAGCFNGYEDGTYKLDDYVMRSEFCHTLSVLLGMDFTGVDIDCGFADVSASHWGKKAISYVVSMGYMQDKNGYFYPERLITLNEAFAAFLNVLGEDGTDMSVHGRLLENVDTTEAVITRGNFTQLAYNFINEYARVNGA